MTQVALTPTATADLRRLDPAVARRVVTKLHRLAENIETVRLETLAGPWQGVFKLRVGDYRVLYTREQTQRRVVVHFIRHRREVYKMNPTFNADAGLAGSPASRQAPGGAISQPLGSGLSRDDRGEDRPLMPRMSVTTPRCASENATLTSISCGGLSAT